MEQNTDAPAVTPEAPRTTTPEPAPSRTPRATRPAATGGAGTTAPDPGTPAEVGSEAAADAPSASGNGAGGTTGTGARRRRRRGGRGRGRGGGGPRPATTSDGETATDATSGVDGDTARDGVVDTGTTPEVTPATRPTPKSRTSAAGSGSGGGAARQRTRTPKPAAAAAAVADPAAQVSAPTAPRRRSPARPKPTDANEVGPADAADTASSGDAGLTVAANGEGTPTTGDGTTTSGAPRRRRRRGGRGRGRSGPVTVGDVGDDDGDMTESAETQRDDAEPDADAAPAPSRTGTRRRGGSSAKPAAGADEKAPAPAGKSQREMTLEERVAAGGPTRRIRSTRTRTGGGEGRGRRRRESMPTPPRVTDKVMVITEHGERDQIAVLEENVLVQHYVTRIGATSMVGNIYLGRVQNVLPGMEAAFVDVGRGRNGVLYAGEVNYNPEDVEGPAPRIEQLLKPGQAVMVQVTKDPMGGKGARLTANLSLAGRYIVLAPNQNLQGISRRLGDDARKRLKTMLKRVKPEEHGVIVRTAAEAATEEALETDLRRLLAIWNDINKKASKRGVKAPIGLYEEPELTVRVVRDLFTDEEFKSLVTDSQRVYDRVMEYVREVAPDLEPKVHLHTGKLAAFEEHRVVEQIHKALDRKVWLPSGGYLIIERTEAMTIVDVNTGKSVGKTNLEETVVNTNLEAAKEVARQLRLRDIGGIIVVDFIDMLLEKNKKQVEDTMRDALALDKTRSQVFEIGPLGLMQVTRKRVSSGLVESFSETCPTCEGRGILLTYDVN